VEVEWGSARAGRHIGVLACCLLVQNGNTPTSHPLVTGNFSLFNNYVQISTENFAVAEKDCSLDR
jgi:hypothetical protein